MNSASLADALGRALAVVDAELVEPLELGLQAPRESPPSCARPGRPGDLGERAQARERHVLRVLEVGDVLRPQVALAAEDVRWCRGSSLAGIGSNEYTLLKGR